VAGGGTGAGPVMAISRTDSHCALRSHALTLACGQPSRVWVHVRRRPASVCVCPIHWRACACACVIGLHVSQTSLSDTSSLLQSSEKLSENNGPPRCYRFPAVVLLCYYTVTHCYCLNARRCFSPPTHPAGSVHDIICYTG